MILKMEKIPPDGLSELWEEVYYDINFIPGRWKVLRDKWRNIQFNRFSLAGIHTLWTVFERKAVTRCGVCDTPLQERRRSAGGIKDRPRVTGRRKHLRVAEGNGLLTSSNVPQRPWGWTVGDTSQPSEGGRMWMAVSKQYATLWPRSAKAARRRTCDVEGWQEGGKTEEELWSNEENPQAPHRWSGDNISTAHPQDIPGEGTGQSRGMPHTPLSSESLASSAYVLWGSRAQTHGGRPPLPPAGVRRQPADLQ